MMDGKNRKKAEELAALNWTVCVIADNLSDGHPVYVAYPMALEMDGCMAQGATREEAISNLEDCLANYIEFMLDDGLPIPIPVKTISESTSAGPAS